MDTRKASSAVVIDLRIGTSKCLGQTGDDMISLFDVDTVFTHVYITGHPRSSESYLMLYHIRNR